MLTQGEDVLCQWCRKVILVSLGGASETKGHMSVREFVEYGAKFYCAEPCFENLKGMAKFVRRSL